MVSARLTGVIVRPARLSDAYRIREIYNLEVTTSTATLDLEPRSLEDQQQYLSHRTGAFVVVVAESDSEITGFGSLSPYRDRPGYLTSAEDSVYVDRDWHGHGVGSAILTELLRLAHIHGFHTVMARIIGPQQASMALHVRHGFELVGIEREVARKFGRWHDVALMQCMLEQVPA